MRNLFFKCHQFLPKPRVQSFIRTQYCQKNVNKGSNADPEDTEIDRQRKYNRSMYDFEYLFDMRQSELVYKVIQMQRQIDSYEDTIGMKFKGGRDKVRIKYPGIKEMLNFNAYNSRRIAFKVVYLGWDYNGYAWSSNSYKSSKVFTNVVERVFLEALLRQQLIPRISDRVNLDRCGRTDKGVSGISQVISVNVRSNLDAAYGLWRSRKERKKIYENEDGIESQTKEESEANDQPYKLEEWMKYEISDRSLDQDEIPYIKLLNEALPEDIRVLAWSPVKRTFSPRRSCLKRTYRYFLPLGGLDINLMKESAQRLIGEHDFANFAKLSSDNMREPTIRTLNQFDIDVLSSSCKISQGNEFDICAITVSSTGFVYRQVRFMIGILYLIGNGSEDPTIIDDLLNVEKIKGRPEYSSMAALPLILFDSEYSNELIDWRWDDEALKSTAQSFGKWWCDHAIKCEITRTICNYIMSKLTLENREEIENSCNSELLLHDGFSHYKKISEMEVLRSRQEFLDRQKQKSIRRLKRKGRYNEAVEMDADPGYENVGWRSG